MTLQLHTGKELGDFECKVTVEGSVKVVVLVPQQRALSLFLQVCTSIHLTNFFFFKVTALEAVIMTIANKLMSLSTIVDKSA